MLDICRPCDSVEAGGKKRHPEVASVSPPARKTPGNGRETCVLRLARAIRRAIRAAAKRARAGAGAQDTRESGSAAPGSRAAAPTPPFVMFAAFNAAAERMERSRNGGNDMRKTDRRSFNEANPPAKQYLLSRSRERASGRATGQGLAGLREGDKHGPMPETSAAHAPTACRT